jgi:integrase
LHEAQAQDNHKIGSSPAFRRKASGTPTSGAGVCLDALGAAELPAIHFHDLKRTGNTLAANAGASLHELMERMGHDSERGSAGLSAPSTTKDS